MFTAITIEGYRSLSELKIKNLSQFNIFFGKNNCGKSALLEAVFMLTGVSNPLMLVKCNRFRGYNKIKEFAYFFNKLDTQKQIHIESVGDTIFKRTLNMTLVKRERSQLLPYDDEDFSTNNVKSETLQWDSVVNGKAVCARFQHEFEEITETGSILEPSDYDEQITACFLAPSYSFQADMRAVEKILTEQKELLVIHALQHFDSRILDFILVRDEIFINIGLPSRIPLNFLGDGVRKIFSIIVNIVACKAGVLLVDELDNGMHFSVMREVWSFIIDFARENNVQIFATTHNIDSLNGLKQYIDCHTDMGNSFSFYKLIRDEKDVVSTLYYPSENFSYMLEMENEVR